MDLKTIQRRDASVSQGCRTKPNRLALVVISAMAFVMANLNSGLCNLHGGAAHTENNAL